MATEYSKAHKLAEKEYKRLISQGINPFVPALERMVPGVSALNRVPVGVTEIPIEMIGGTLTEMRQDAFSPSWYPMMKEGTEFSSKWEALYEAQMTEGIRDPIKVVEFMRSFYVIEGNKRVSVLHYLGSPMIMADVTRILPPPSDSVELKVYEEFTRFYKVSGIYDIGFTVPGSYQEFADLLGQDMEKRWDRDLCDTIRSAYRRFSMLYRKNDEIDMDMEPGDAFLSYLRFFPLDSLIYEDDATMLRRVGRVRKEHRTEQNRDNINYVESSEAASITSGTSTSTGLGIFGFGRSKPTYSAANPLRIAFIHDRDTAVSHRINNHELGRKHLEERFGDLIETYSYFNTIKEGPFASAAEEREKYKPFDNAVDDAAAKGCQVIFTTTPALLPRAMVAALQHPDIKFLNCSINLSHSAIRCYDCRMYEVKFIMGALAACYAENHEIGYLAGTPSPETISNINAFAIGASLVDPYARVHLAWRSQKDTDWEKLMKDAGVSVLSDIDFVSEKDAAEGRAYGLYAWNPDGSILSLAKPILNWGRYYELIALSLYNNAYDTASLYNSDRALNYWLGLSDGVVDITPSEELPFSSKNLIELLRGGFLAGILNPFEGELHSQEGVIKKEEDPDFTRDDILAIDWLNENVIGEIPAIETLRDSAKTVASVTGVAKE